MKKLSKLSSFSKAGINSSNLVIGGSVNTNDTYTSYEDTNSYNCADEIRRFYTDGEYSYTVYAICC